MVNQPFDGMGWVHEERQLWFIEPCRHSMETLDVAWLYKLASEQDAVALFPMPMIAILKVYKGD